MEIKRVMKRIKKSNRGKYGNFTQTRRAITGWTMIHTPNK